MQKFSIIILAAGHGKRMQSDLPKVLVPFKGKPMIRHLLEAVADSGLCELPTIVVGKMAETVMDALGTGYEYVFQQEQLGTGHAVMAAEKNLRGKSDNVLVLYGDQPTVTRKMIENLARTHVEQDCVLTMGTVTLPDFEDWRDHFKLFSRIIRDEKGDILRSVEFKDATETEKEILEVNPAFFCFKSAWLWNHLHEIRNENTQKEYYLTDLIKAATDEGERIASFQVEPKDALGINTKEHLELLEKVMD